MGFTYPNSEELWKLTCTEGFGYVRMHCTLLMSLKHLVKLGSPRVSSNSVVIKSSFKLILYYIFLQRQKKNSLNLSVVY